MTLYIFNPEHDIALASGLSNFTAPHAARQLRHDLGFLPALWADDDGVVLVDDEERARRSWQKLRARLAALNLAGSLKASKWEFEAFKVGVSRHETQGLQPWGWDSALCAALKRRGVADRLLPSAEQLEHFRLLSHRRTAARLLPKLQQEGTTGEAFECTTDDEVAALLGRYGRIVLKAPWSSSGRGLRFADVATTDDEKAANDRRWLRNVIARQGSVMVEPYYNKVKDFGMEFEADGQGGISYCGLSLFHTVNGAYEGNVLATERSKQNELSRYLSVGLLETVKQSIISSLSLGDYRGPFGVDMMIVASANGNGFLLHPCVEVNLRRTMGHVALAISPTDDDVRRVMRIVYANENYQLIIQRL